MKNNKTKSLVLIFSLVVVLLTSCDPAKKWEKEEQKEIQSYLGSIGDTVYTLKPSGLYYLDLIVGTGISPVLHDTVSIKYKGMYLSGAVFGTNYTDTTKLVWVVGSGAILEGLDEGVRYMKEGGKAKMLLPSSLAYGSYGYYSIPGYTPLLFEVQLVKVKPVAVKK
jgi:FKBP-type peptidyl-prolyl cis-trans isomerase FkpA